MSNNHAHSFTEGSDAHKDGYDGFGNPINEGHDAPWPLSTLAQVTLFEAERLKLGVFARQVAAMRESQRQYFKLIAIAKKTRTKDAFREAHEELTRSKNLEALVDHAVFNILNPRDNKPKAP